MIEFIITTILLLNPIQPAAAAPAEIFDFGNQNLKPVKINNNNLGVKLTADNFSVKDVESNKILYAKNPNKPVPVASLTKLMTALIFLQTEPDWQAEMEMSRVDETSGAYPHLYRGETVTVENLFNTMLISSDNNSAKALVRASGLTEKEFIEKMNNHAKALGLKNTQFFEVTGLSKQNVSTAEDISTLLLAALEKAKIKKAAQQPALNFQIKNNGKNRRIYSTNRLLESFLNSKKNNYKIIGGKTGYLPAAGGCLAVAVEKENSQVVSVVLGSDNMQTRFSDTKALIDWAFANYKW